MHEWMVDNGFTPHIVVDAGREGVRVPEAHVRDGQIVLNIGAAATHGLSLGNEVLTFEARFGGKPEQLVVPIAAVLGIYSKETGQGMLFGESEETPPPTTTPSSGEERRAKLKVVK